MFVSEIYSITDAYYALIAEQTYTSTTSSGDHAYYINPNVELTLPNNCEITFKAKSNNAGLRIGLHSKSHYSGSGYSPGANPQAIAPNYGVFAQQITTYGVGVYRDTSTHGVGSDRSMTGTEYHNWKIVKQGTSISWYCDDVQFSTAQTLSWIGSYTDYTPVFYYWRTGACYIKDLVIKPTS